MPNRGPTLPLSQQIHADKYRGPGESFDDAVSRVVGTLSDDEDHARAFGDAVGSMRFLPAGRVQAAIGSTRNICPYNCNVSGTIRDDMVDGPESIMGRLHQAATTMRMGVGVGYDFSTLRPMGDLIKGLGSTASGPISFMHIYDAMCKSIASSGHRRGAQMGVLRVDHPDIHHYVHSKQPTAETKALWDFAEAEQDPEKRAAMLFSLQSTLPLTAFNISVAITDEFMECRESGRPFRLTFEGDVRAEIDAAELWDDIMRSTHDWSEPGVLFIDTINRKNNLYYCETIAATNPCFTGDTRVWTADGHVPFSELAGREDVRVLTQTDEGKMVYRDMRSIRVTQRAAPLVRVTFDDGGVVRCTPNHEFFLKDGRRVAAEELAVGVPVISVRQNTNHRVVSVERLTEVEDVYCGTVDETGRFFIALGDDGVLVKNCAEQPLPPHGNCLLGSFNLTRYLSPRGDGTYDVDEDLLRRDIPHVVRAMDNVVDNAIYPLPEQEREAKSKRRMGLGVTGVANALEACGHRYGEAGYVVAQDRLLWLIERHAYIASARLASQKGQFPLFDRDRYLAGEKVREMDDEVRREISQHGMRNSHLTSIAPTGTISLTADNVSSGIEPVFSYEAVRTIRGADGPEDTVVRDYGADVLGVRGKTADEVTVQEHLAVLECAYRHVDSAVSKTCNVPGSTSWDQFKGVYEHAYEVGCKGCTTFRIDGKRFGVIRATPEVEETITTEGEACWIDPVTGQRSCE